MKANAGPHEDARVRAWESARGSLTISHPVPGVIVFTYHGYIAAEVVPFIEAEVDWALERRLRPDLFIDLSLMTGYESAYRKAVSAWGARVYRRLGTVRVLVRSKLMAMGIAVSNLTAANKLQPTASQPQFQADIRDAIRRHPVDQGAGH